MAAGMETAAGDWDAVYRTDGDVVGPVVRNGCGSVAGHGRPTIIFNVTYIHSNESTRACTKHSQ